MGFGAWGIGGSAYGEVDRSDALRALATAEELGCNFVDTAAVYGDSEEIIGAFLRGRRDRWIVATKYSGQPEGLMATAERQLGRLGIDTIDFYQIHWAPGPQERHLYDQLAELKASGKARYVGVSLNTERDIDYVLEHGLVDGFQVSFNLLEPRPFLARLERIREKKPGVIVRSSLKSGFLTGKFEGPVSFGEADHRGSLGDSELQGILDGVDAFRFLEEHAPSLTVAAASYPLAFPEVSTVIVGTKSRHQAVSNFGSISSDILGPEALQAIALTQEALGIDRTGAGREWIERAKGVLRRLLHRGS